MYIGPFYFDTKIFNNLPVRAIYLYGSYAEKKTNEKSDIDIALIVEDKNNINIRDILRKINRSFKYPEKLHLTIVDLNSSSPLLLYQIIKKGQLIYEKQLNDHIFLESYIMRHYFDDQYRQEIYYQRLKKNYAN